MSNNPRLELTQNRKKLYLTVFIMSVCIGTALFALPLLLIKKFQASVFMVGFIGSLGALGYTLACLSTGRLSDGLGRKKIILSGIILFISGYIFLADVGNIISIGILFIVGSIGMSLFWPPIQAWIAESIDKNNLTKVLGNFNLSWSTGLMLGPLCGGFLFPINYKLPFYFACLAGAVMFVLIFRIPETRGLDVLEKEIRPTEPVKGEQKKGFLFIAWTANFSSLFIIVMLRNLFPVLAVSLDIGPRVLGVLIFLIGFSQTVMFACLGRIRGWHYNINLLLFFQVLAGTGLAIGFFAGSNILFGLSFILMGLSAGMVYFSSIFYSLDVDHGKGRNTGFHESIIGAGMLFGPLLGGILGREYGLRAPYLLGLGLLFCAILVQIALYYKVVKKKDYKKGSYVVRHNCKTSGEMPESG